MKILNHDKGSSWIDPWKMELRFGARFYGKGRIEIGHIRPFQYWTFLSTSPTANLISSWKAAKKAEREAKKEAKLAKKLTSRKAKTETDAVKNTTSGKKEQVEVAEKPQLEDSMAEEPVQNGKKKRKKSFQEDLPPAKRIATPNCSNCGSNILSIKNMRPCPQHADFFLCTKCRAMDELLVPHLKCSEQRVRRDAAARAICMLRPTA